MNRDVFGAKDLNLLLDTLQCNPSAAAAAQAIKYVEEVCRYPIQDLNALAKVFDRFGDAEKCIALGDCAVSMGSAERYIPMMSFPLERRDQLLSALLCAFEAARIETLDHALAEQRKLAREGRLMGGLDG